MIRKQNAQSDEWSPIIKQMIGNAEASFRWARVRDLRMALAWEEAGRGDDLDAEILSCFKKNGAHDVNTITRRLFKARDPEYRFVDFVEREIERLFKSRKLIRRSHKRTYRTLYILATPERLAEIQKRKVEYAAEQAENVAMEARQTAVINRLHQAGYASATAKQFHRNLVIITVADLERLMGLDTRQEETVLQ